MNIFIDFYTVQAVSLVQLWVLRGVRDEQAHTQTHGENTGGWLCVSPPRVLQSIDPARLLSAGYVSCTAALPVRGRAKAVQVLKRRKEAQINVETSNNEERKAKQRKAKEGLMMTGIK